MKLSRTIYSALAFVTLLLIIGTAGGMEWGLISLREGVVRSLALMVMWIFCTYRAGLFYWQTKKPISTNMYRAKYLNGRSELRIK